MEKHGIGTDASIPTHINNICERNYVTVRQQGAALDTKTLNVKSIACQPPPLPFRLPHTVWQVSAGQRVVLTELGTFYKALIRLVAFLVRQLPPPLLAPPPGPHTHTPCVAGEHRSACGAD
jgi:hypothetical protein